MTENAASVAVGSTPEGVRAWLRERVAYYLEAPAASIDPEALLADYGLDSVYAFALCGEIEDTLGVAVEPTLIWDVATLAELADRIVELAAGADLPGG